MEGELGPFLKMHPVMVIGKPNPDLSFEHIASRSLYLLNGWEPSIPDKYFESAVIERETSLILKYVEILLG